MKKRNSAAGVVLALATLSGCAAHSGEVGQLRAPTVSQGVSPRPLEKVPYRRSDLLGREGTAAPEVIVRFKEMPSDQRPAGAGAEQLVNLTPLLPVAIASVPAIIITSPIWGPALATMQHRDKIVAKALEETQFPRRLEEALRSRLLPHTEQTSPSDLRLEVLIRGYGLADARERGLCWVMEAEFAVLTADASLLFRDDVFWGPSKRSEDAPPPQCGSLDDFAAEEGKLASATAVEASEIVSALIARRLRTKP